MDFTPQAIEALRAMSVKLDAWKSSRALKDSSVFKRMAEDLHAAAKFIVPPPDKLNIKVTEACMPFMRLPYPVCVFEYSINNPVATGVAAAATYSSSKRIALSYDLQSKSTMVDMLKRHGFVPMNAHGIAVISLYFVDSTKEWMPSCGIGVFNVDEHVVRDEKAHVYRHYGNSTAPKSSTSSSILLDNGETNLGFNVYPLIGAAVDDVLAGGTRAETIMSVMVNDVSEELAVAMRVAVMLNARNVNAVEAVPEPKMFNKKRMRLGRGVHYEYKTLDIFVAGGARVHRKLNADAFRKLFDVAKTKGFHSVMGHFKTRSSGVYWWNSFLRGDPVHGTINKEYSVKEKK